MKKAIPYFLLLVLFIIAIVVKQYRERQPSIVTEQEVKRKKSERPTATKGENENNLDDFRNPSSTFFFTKHARCRMKCRHITQEEVKEIVRKTDVNYNKSDLNAPQGAKYALEGYTSIDKQHVRIIVAPKQKHLTVVTVIDLDREWECPSCK